MNDIIILCIIILNYLLVSLGVLYCVAMGSADLWGITDLHCPKVKCTKWLKHKLRATLGGQ